MSITVIWLAAQPSAIALPRRSYWRIADSVLWMTCLRLDWRTYSRAVLDRWVAVTFEEAVSVNTDAPSPGIAGGQVPASATASPARAWTSSVATGPGSWPGGRAAGEDAGVVLLVAAQVRWARARRQAVTPLLMSTPSPSGNAVARACRAA